MSSPQDARNVLAAAAILEGFGLSEKEARVLASLVTSGSASAARLAQEADLYRTNIYPVLEALDAKRLAGRLPGRAAVWASPGRDEVIERLFSAEERHLEHLRSRKEELRELLTPPAEANRDETSLAQLQLVVGPDETARVYYRMLRSATEEVLVFNRAPYGAILDQPSDVVVLDLLERGVKARVLYRRLELEDPESRVEAEVYLRAGVEARITDELPTKLVVADRRSVLVAIMEPDDRSDSDAVFPVSQYVDHSGFAAPWAEVFERYWSTSTPYHQIHKTDAELAERAPSGLG